MTRSARRLVGLAVAFVLTAACASAQPDMSAALALGISGPVDADQARAIAAQRVVGTVSHIEDDPEDAGVTFDVIMMTAEGPVEVEVRQSDGAVLEVEPADDAVTEEDDEEGDDNDDPADDDQD